tara:strand:- start:294 stop:461 length:168 start_codon:yes stop_codon:yes gene_type:complete
MFKPNDKIIIKDESNFYFGREATVVSVDDFWADIWNINIGCVYMTINQRNMEAVQ